MDKHYRLRNSSIDFAFYPSGGPIDELITTNALFQLLGRASAAWARLELMLDVLLLHINKESEAPELYKRHPNTFKEKIDLLRRWLKHPKLAPEADISRRSLSIFKELANTRNDVLHSCITAYDPQTETISFASLQPLGKDNFQLRTGEYSMNRLRVLLSLANNSTLALTEWADLVMPRLEDQEQTGNHFPAA